MTAMLPITAFLRLAYAYGKAAATVHLHGATEEAILPHLYELILRTLVISRAHYLYGIYIAMSNTCRDSSI